MKFRTACNQCLKERGDQDFDVTKKERKQRPKGANKVSAVIQKGGKNVGITVGDRTVEF